MLTYMKLFKFLGTRCELREKKYFDQLIKEDLKQPNPYLDALLTENTNDLRERASNIMASPQPLIAIILPESDDYIEPTDELEIEGLSLFLEPTADALSNLRFTCYEK